MRVAESHASTSRLPMNAKCQQMSACERIINTREQWKQELRRCRMEYELMCAAHVCVRVRLPCMRWHLVHRH